jgi:hypothetical protein
VKKTYTISPEPRRRLIKARPSNIDQDSAVGNPPTVAVPFLDQQIGPPASPNLLANVQVAPKEDEPKGKTKRILMSFLRRDGKSKASSTPQQSLAGVRRDG